MADEITRLAHADWEVAEAKERVSRQRQLIARLAARPQCERFVEWKAKGSEGKADLRDRYERRCTVRHRRYLGELEGACFGRMESDICNHHHRCAQGENKRVDRPRCTCPQLAAAPANFGLEAG